MRTAEAAATPCALRHDLIAVRLLAPELAPPTSAVFRARDPETGAVHRVDWRAAAARANYEGKVREWREGVDELCGRLGVDLLDIAMPRGAADAERALAAPLLRFFRNRELRGGRA